MDIKYLEPEFEHYSFCKLEYKDHWIETQFTIFRGIRVTIREKDSRFYITNWCCGEISGGYLPLLWAALTAIDKEMDLQKLPFERVRPYFKDPEFVIWLETHLEAFNPSLENFIDLGSYLVKNLICYSEKNKIKFT